MQIQLMLLIRKVKTECLVNEKLDQSEAHELDYLNCTKEKTLHVLDKITWIANLGHTSKAQAKTHRSSCSCRSQRWSEQPRWHS